MNLYSLDNILLSKPSAYITYFFTLLVWSRGSDRPSINHTSAPAARTESVWENVLYFQTSGRKTSTHTVKDLRQESEELSDHAKSYNNKHLHVSFSKWCNVRNLFLIPFQTLRDVCMTEHIDPSHQVQHGEQATNFYMCSRCRKLIKSNSYGLCCFEMLCLLIPFTYLLYMPGWIITLAMCSVCNLCFFLFIFQRTLEGWVSFLNPLEDSKYFLFTLDQQFT